MPVRVNPAIEVSPSEANAALAAGKALVVDVRTQPEWDAVHIPGTDLIPLNEIATRADEVEPMPGQQVLLLCHHGRRSLDAMNVLRATGRAELANAKSIAGGIEAWALEADATVARYERGPTGVRLLP